MDLGDRCTGVVGDPVDRVAEASDVFEDLPFYGPETLTLLGRFQSFEQVLPGYGTGDTPDYFEMAKDAEQHNTSDLTGHPLGTA